MSSLITNATIQIRKDTAGNWTSNNPTPAAGEWCLETDTGRTKIGNGSTAWTSLLYSGEGITGEIKTWPLAAAPTGFLICNGAAISRTTYARLFAVISTNFGVGDGSTTFNLPDYRGLFLRGAGAHGTLNMADGNDVDGGSVGNENVDQMFAHWHEFEFRGNTTPSNSTLYINHGISVGPSATQSTSNDGVKGAYTDGVNGPPNDGPETYPSHGVINWIIKL